jgi:hypothetical protein
MAEQVGQYQVTTYTTPAASSALSSSVVRGNLNTGGTAHNSHDNDAGIHLQSSALASRPAAGTAGRKWLTTDGLRVYYDTGSVWSELAYLSLAAGGTVTGAVTLSAAGTALAVTNNATIGGTLAVTGAVTTGTINGQTISSAASLTGTLAVASNATVGGTLSVTGAASLSSTLGVTGLATLNRAVANGTHADGTYSLQAVAAAGAARDVFLAGVNTVSNGFTVQYDGTRMLYDFAAIGATDSTTVGTTLTVTGAATLSSTLAVTGAVTGGTYNGQTISSSASLTGTLAVAGATTLNGAVTLGDAVGDTITVTGRVGSNIVPSTTATYDLGTSGNAWLNLFLGTGATINVAGNVVVRGRQTGWAAATGTATKRNTSRPFQSVVCSPARGLRWGSGKRSPLTSKNSWSSPAEMPPAKSPCRNRGVMALSMI